MIHDLREKPDECQLHNDDRRRFFDRIPEVVRELAHSCSSRDCYDHISPTPLPSRHAVIDIVERARDILFPGYFSSATIDAHNLEYYLGQEVTRLYTDLTTQISRSVRHDCFRHQQDCKECSDMGHEEALRFIAALPDLRAILGTDVRAASEGDPASSGVDEIIFSYPGLTAVSVFRMAHLLTGRSIPLLPRIMTEYAHNLTGIDIHPGATIGDSFFIDHGTGVVIGQTCEIGRRVRLYQGVTLGALSLPPGAGTRLRGKKRHPTIEDDVIVYSGTTILGGDTVIGARSVIGGNVWLTESVPPDTKIFLKRPELIYKNGAPPTE